MTEIETPVLSSTEGKRSKRGLIAMIAGGSAAALLLAGGAIVFSNYKTVTVSADGSTQSVSTFASDVSGALADAGISVGANDLVVPAPASELVSGSSITIKRAQAVTVGDATLWTTEGSVAAAVAASGDANSYSASRSVQRLELTSLPLVTEGAQVTVVADGKTQTVTVNADMEATDVLKLAGVQVSPIDEVKAEISAAGEVTVTVVRVVRSVTGAESAIDFKTVEEHTEDLYEDESEVAQEGAPGTLITYTYAETRDGKPVVSVKTGEKVKAEPKNKVVRIGTKERPAQQQPAAPQGGGSQESVNYTVGGDVWAALAQCESGGNPATNTGNGYYGMYQFSLPTWYAVGGTGLPSEASAAEQTMRAQILQQRAGWGQWPACTSMLGLR
ncbi:MAG: transglycosylase family protein [Buchananella hordeovulneris]|nr:transglycosylase family protein [Buchananella hordeovulneris]